MRVEKEIVPPAFSPIRIILEERRDLAAVTWAFETALQRGDNTLATQEMRGKLRVTLGKIELLKKSEQKTPAVEPQHYIYP